MDLFNKKRVAELEKKNEQLKNDICELRSERDHLKLKLSTAVTLHESTPEDCKRGKWCEACEFAKEFHYSSGWVNRTGYFCGKGESCNNFIQKKED